MKQIRVSKDKIESARLATSQRIRDCKYTGTHPHIRGAVGYGRPETVGQMWQFRPTGEREWYRVNYQNLQFNESQST